MKLEITIERRPVPYSLPDNPVAQGVYISWWASAGRGLDEYFATIDGKSLPEAVVVRSPKFHRNNEERPYEGQTRLSALSDLLSWSMPPVLQSILDQAP